MHSVWEPSFRLLYLPSNWSLISGFKDPQARAMHTKQYEDESVRTHARLDLRDEMT